MELNLDESQSEGEGCSPPRPEDSGKILFPPDRTEPTIENNLDEPQPEGEGNSLLPESSKCSAAKKSNLLAKQWVNIFLSSILGRSWSSRVRANKEIIAILTILLVILLIAGATLLVYLYYQRVPKDGILICGGWSGKKYKDGEKTCEVLPHTGCTIPDLDHMTGNNFLGEHIGENNQKVLLHISRTA